ncbi:MAG TPA: 4Fe-4S binding protein, partial [Bacillota bacterium]|nr:4Fe-4S binding protein [Bacillota bacterium]
MDRIRTVVQIAFVAVTNGYYRGFAEGTIFKGDTKNLCLPGLNCYSCPGALGSCPIGSLQAVS